MYTTGRGSLFRTLDMMRRWGMLCDWLAVPGVLVWVWMPVEERCTTLLWYRNELFIQMQECAGKQHEGVLYDACDVVNDSVEGKKRTGSKHWVCCVDEWMGGYG